jgi:hypothetical protein
MRQKYSLVSVIVLALLAFGITVGCTKAPSDAQIASNVQNKIFSDSNVPSRQIQVNSGNGVVTLSGYVNSDMERSAAAADAAQVAGVKTVVNNLQTAPPQTATVTPPVQPPAAPEVLPVPPVRETRPKPRPERRNENSGLTPGQRRSSPSDTTTMANNSMASNVPPAPIAPAAPVVPPPPPPPQKVTVPDGTLLSVRLIDPIDSETAQQGQTFRASLDSPIVVDDQVVIPAKADVDGDIVTAKSAGKFAGQSELAIELTRVRYNGHTYDLHTNQWSKQGSSRGKNTAEKVGGGAALGAIIGGLAGGGRGAAIGATVGGGAGGGVQAATHGQQIKLNSEQVISFRLQNPITVIPAKSVDRGSGSQRMSDSGQSSGRPRLSHRNTNQSGSQGSNQSGSQGSNQSGSQGSNQSGSQPTDDDDQ